MPKVLYYSKTAEGEIVARVYGNRYIVQYRPNTNKSFVPVIQSENGSLECHYFLSSSVIKLLNHAFKMCKDKVR